MASARTPDADAPDSPVDAETMAPAQSKAEGAFRTISEVADQLDVPQHVLRFWETRFTQIKPMKRAGGRRYYSPEDVMLLEGIRHLLYGEGYTLKGVQRILREKGVRDVKAIGLKAAGGPAPESPEDTSAADEAAPLVDEMALAADETASDQALREPPTPPFAAGEAPQDGAATEKDGEAKDAVTPGVTPLPAIPSPAARARLEDALRALARAEEALARLTADEA